MTVQAPEWLVLDGVKHQMSCSELLPESHPRIIERDCPELTACWRGYVGQWQIKEGRFYLVGFIFGRYELQGDEPLFADWFTGTLYVARGEMIERNCGFAVFEETLQIDIEDGVVTETRVIDNRGKQRNASGPKNSPGSENESANGDERGIGCGRIVALFVAVVVLILMTFLARARLQHFLFEFYYEAASLHVALGIVREFDETALKRLS